MVTVEFSNIRTGAITNLGSYDWLQLTYGGLRSAPDGEHIAYLDERSGYWYLSDDPLKVSYTDVVIGNE